MANCPSTVFCTRFSALKVPSTCMRHFPTLHTHRSAGQQRKQQRQWAGTFPGISSMLNSVLVMSGMPADAAEVFMLKDIYLAITSL